MKSLTAAEAVYANYELLDTILNQLSRDELKEIRPTSNVILRHSAGILHRNVGTRWMNCIVKHMGRQEVENPGMSRLFKALLSGVRHIDASLIKYDMDLDGEWVRFRNDYTSSFGGKWFNEVGLRKLRDLCPKLRRITTDNNDNLDHPRWTIHWQDDDKYTISLICSLSFNLNEDFKEEPRTFCGYDQLEFAQSKGAEITYVLTQDWMNGGGSDRKTIGPKLQQWISEGKLPRDIYGLRMTCLPLTIRQVQSAILNRYKQNLPPFSEIDMASIEPYTISEFRVFCQRAGKDLKVLALSTENEETEEPVSLLNIVDLSTIVDILKEHCPNLERLSLSLESNSGFGVFSDEEIPLSESSFDGRLKRISVFLVNVHYSEYGGDTPVAALARNLACLGGKECKYELFNIEPQMPPFLRSKSPHQDNLHKMIRWLRHLPRERQTTIRQALLTPLGISAGQWEKIFDLEFNHNDEPIRLEISTGRRSLAQSEAWLISREQLLLKGQRIFAKHGLRTKAAAKIFSESFSFTMGHIEKAKGYVEKIQRILKDTLGGIEYEDYDEILQEELNKIELEVKEERHDKWEQLDVVLPSGLIFFGSAFEDNPPRDVKDLELVRGSASEVIWSFVEEDRRYREIEVDWGQLDQFSYTKWMRGGGT